MQPLVSIIVPCYNEEKYVSTLLDNILQQDYPRDRLEVFFVDGMSTDRTREIILGIATAHSFIRLLDNENRYVPYALNKGVAASSGEFIFRMDAHSEFPPDYCRRLVEWHSRIRADFIGGVCITEVKNRNPLSNSIKKVLGSRFGVGDSVFRTGTSEVKEVDTVAFGCYRREVFTKAGLFNEHLVRNQDIEFSSRIRRNGGKIMIVPDVSWVYFTRETLHGLASNNFGNGKWVILTMYYSGYLSGISLRHLVPMFFLLSIILPLLLSLAWLPLGLISAASLLFYFLIVLFVSAGMNAKDVSLWNLVRTFFTLHFSYGTGSLAGIAWLAGRLFTRKK